MLTEKEIKSFLEEDEASSLKQAAKVGQDYYEGRHDILDFRMFYYNADGNLIEDKYRSNAKIPHPFFTELVDQATQFLLSGEETLVSTEDEKLQEELDVYFNKNMKFNSEFVETVTGMQAKGFDYIYAYKGEDGRFKFENSNCMGVVEVEGRFTEDGKDHVIYKYLDRIDKEGLTQWKILVLDSEKTWYYKQTEDGEIVKDEEILLNPKPHAVYSKGKKLYTKPIGFLPFFRLENNKRKMGFLPPIKALIDDYDLMASSLTNNLADFDTPIHVVKGFKGDNLDELQQNLKTKKLIGTAPDGGIEVHTVDVPYAARVAKLELDEKSIYRFGMGLNLAGLKDTSATTNMAIKAAYSLLELRCNKMANQVKLFLQQLTEVALGEINERLGTAYNISDVSFKIKPQLITNGSEIAQIELTKAQEKQAEINTLLAVANYLDNETVVKKLCEVLDVNYLEIKDKLPDLDEPKNSIEITNKLLGGGLSE